MNYHDYTAERHDLPALAADAATALAARKIAGPNSSPLFYRAIYWNAAGTADVVDCFGTAKKIVTVAGATYPLQNCGVISGANTSLAQGDFVCLY